MDKVQKYNSFNTWLFNLLVISLTELLQICIVMVVVVVVVIVTTFLML
jgi:hypothetical protein